MEVTIDKFGRILIPKKIREALGLKPGQVLELFANKKTSKIELVSLKDVKATVNIKESGLPVIEFNPPVEMDIDVVEWIKGDREERTKKISGI